MDLVNYKNYYVYAGQVQNPEQLTEIYVPTDIDRNNIYDHITGIFNILSDGVETELVHNFKIRLSWGGDINCKLSIIDYWYNLFMWYMILKENREIRPCNILWDTTLKKKHIKNFIDTYVIRKEQQIEFGNDYINEIICDATHNFSLIEKFSGYVSNTINNEDDIALMNASKEFNDLIHCSLKDIPFDNIKEEGMRITNRAIDIIENSESILGYEHSLTNSFRSAEAINPRQFKEVQFNIGTKPNTTGGVYPEVIDSSFKMGGVYKPKWYFIESDNARSAQIMSKTNVGESGNFARLLGINNTDTTINKDMNYECMSRNFVKFEIKSPKHLSMVKNRYYRFSVFGMEYLLDENDLSLIGKTIYLKSPMTCASNSSGKGICHKCYGDLYYTNLKVNVGKMAAEILSSVLTQILLSAKHLLETKIVKIVWNPEFEDYFSIDINSISLNDLLSDNVDLKRYTLIIDPDEIELVNEDADYSSSFEDENSISLDANYNEYITRFWIRTPEGQEIEFSSETKDQIYISQELNSIIRKKAYNVENKFNVPLSALTDVIMFYININNNEIRKTMDNIIHVINKSSVTSGMNKDEALQSIVDLVIEGGLDIDAVHLEVILSNQIVNPDNILSKPNWNVPDVQYKIFTLNQALTNNPSVIVSLLYEDLNRTLYNPLTFAKHGPSFFDLFYMEQPQNYISDELLEKDTSNIRDLSKGVEMIRKIDKN